MDFLEFKNKYEHKKIKIYPNNVPNNPTVSVCVETYQHASYIKECLDGILMQKTDFPFEILLGEDDSSDGTREICLEYAKKHSDKIKLFLHNRENNLKVFDRPSGRFNLIHNLFSANGKYVAMCSGDDYWIDPLKLQKQFDFMEANKECSACVHDAKMYSQTKKKFMGNYGDRETFRKLWGDKKAMKLQEILNTWHCGTIGSFFMLKKKLEFPVWFPGFYGGDTGLMIIMARKGNIGILRDKMSVYRRENPQSLIGLDQTNRIKILKLKIKEALYLLKYFRINEQPYLVKRIIKQSLLYTKYSLKKIR